VSVAGQVTEPKLEALSPDAAALTLRERLGLVARRNRFATVGAVILVVMGLIAIFGPLVYTIDPLAPQP